VEKHLGTITVESEPGKGSIFIIHFPWNEFNKSIHGDHT